MRLIDADYVLSQLTIDSYAVKDEKYLMAMHRAKEIIKNAPDTAESLVDVIGEVYERTKNH